MQTPRRQRGAALGMGLLERWLVWMPWWCSGECLHGKESGSDKGPELMVSLFLLHVSDHKTHIINKGGRTWVAA